MRDERKQWRGFTLVEIVLALMVVALGMLGIFQLFPSGLRASYDATVETRTAQFAEYVLETIRARVATRDPAPWATADQFRNFAVQELGDFNIRHTGPNWEDARSVYFPDPNGEEIIRYTLNIRLHGDNRASARLVVRYGPTGGERRTYYTEFFNAGVMQQ